MHVFISVLRVRKISGIAGVPFLNIFFYLVAYFVNINFGVILYQLIVL
jgi:hypothetical protein